MPDHKIITFAELELFGRIDNLNEQAKALVSQQKSTWVTAGRNYEAINHVQTKIFDFEHFKIIAQFNAGRIRSSAAKTDAKSISERPCFLCIKHLPPEQKGIIFNDKYIILTNPFPVFQVHLTISKIEHTPQEILGHFSDLLELSRELTEFTLFYNGPQCGASAPDHFHFQAIIKNSLPVEKEFEILEQQFPEIIFENEILKMFAVEHYLRRLIAIVSSDKSEIRQKMDMVIKSLKTEDDNEPLMNVLCSFQDEKWRLLIFPREKHRPSHYFRSDDKKIVASPAAVEMGGVLVLPEEEDFKNITGKEIEEIYGEVTINNERFQKLKSDIKIL
jgi:ATP adenylyltransferase/5',5'''-P-1,P-4-tetraphosphate phosphorylase II